MKSSKLLEHGRSALLAGVLAATALLAACGGGEQESTFTAGRILAFGDETSVINNDGSKYTVNALASGSTTTLDCGANPIWVQSVGLIYGLLFPQCTGTATGPFVSRIYAANGAKAADLAGQIDAHIAAGGFVENDLATVLVGPNDVTALFAQYPAVDEGTLLAAADAAGAEVALQVNRVAALGAKVLVSTIPDLGRSPLAGSRTDPANVAPGVLSRLSTRFNDALLSRLTNDGHKIGLIQLDEYLIAIDNATQAGAGSFSNTTLASCLTTAPLPTCTTATQVADATATGAIWLWADNTHLGASGQASLGSLAITRAQNNPF